MSLGEQVVRDLKEKLGEAYQGEYWKQKNRLYVKLDKSSIVEATKLLMGKHDARLCAISTVDLGERGFDLVYHFALDHKERNLHVNLKPRVPRDFPEIESITPYTPQANWTEREMMELVGITFKNHPDPRHMFLSYDWPEQPK